MNTKTLEALSIGNTACNLQTSVRQVQRTAERLKLEPTLILDNVPFFSGRQVEQLRAALSPKRKTT